MPIDVSQSPVVVQHAKPTHYRDHIGSWTVDLTIDRFADMKQCVVRTRRVTDAGVALVFHLPRHVNTVAAVYRLDDGVPVMARANAMRLASAGIALTGDDLANPSGGHVAVPVMGLASVRTIAIRARPGGRIYRFDLGGWGPARAKAAADGCAFDDTVAADSATAASR